MLKMNMDASAVNGIIKIAITGFGTIGPRHADAVLKNDDLKLVAVVALIPAQHL